MILLDTHAAIWFTTDSSLGKRSQAISDDALADDRLAVSAVSFWEIAMLVAKGRLRSVDSAVELRKQVNRFRRQRGGAHWRCCNRTLEGLRGDPADRFIVATAIANDATLVTADQSCWNGGTSSGARMRRDNSS